MVLGRRRRWGSSRHPAAECRYVERIAPSTPDAAVAGRVIPSRRGEARRSDRRSSAICWRHRGGGRRRRDGPPPWRGAVVVLVMAGTRRRTVCRLPAPFIPPSASRFGRTRREGGAEAADGGSETDRRPGEEQWRYAEARRQADTASHPAPAPCTAEPAPAPPAPPGGDALGVRAGRRRCRTCERGVGASCVALCTE